MSKRGINDSSYGINLRNLPNKSYEEKELLKITPLMKKRKRHSIKRGINCTWSLEDVIN
jgi:hypothetical protein